MNDRSIPLTLKLAFTAFLAVMVPVYWQNYGPTNFLYFCDVALMLTLAGLWLENTLLISMAAVGILAPQVLWLLDFFAGLAGIHFLGLTDYMFDERYALYLRGLSLYHGWLPLLLLFLVWRVGYDRRALAGWTGVAWVLILVSYFFLPPPSPSHGLTPVNINYVRGFSSDKAQDLVPPAAWLVGEMTLFPLLLCLPVHRLLKKLRLQRGTA